MDDQTGKLIRAAGSDNIPSEFLKYGGRDIVDIMYILFNYIWERGEFPKTWAEGIINPLHKKGDVNTPDNYRKVTIMNSICKVFEIVLNNKFNFKNEMLQNGRNVLLKKKDIKLHVPVFGLKITNC